MNESAANTDRLHALAAAREIVRANPYTTPLQLAAMAWLEGRISVCREMRPTLDPRSNELHEYDAICGTCGKRDGSRMAVAADAPKDGFFTTRCFHCSAADDTRAA
jgi:hypothetical protein